MKRQHIALATSLLAGLLPQAAQACGEGDYMGQVCFTAATYCPRGTVEANGQLLQISGNEALYSLLGIGLWRRCAHQLRSAGSAWSLPQRAGPGSWT